MEEGGPSRPEIRRDDVGGVPVFSLDGSNMFMGALLFRSGRADEDLRSNGVNHLVEHLAVHPFQNLHHPHGAFVDDTRVVFHASGEPDEVVAYLNGICRNLVELPHERIVDERRVLRVESHNAPPSSPAWGLRFGAEGYGLTSYPEYGLHWLEAEHVSSWTASRLTRGNAALFFNGPVPDGLDLGILPDGERLLPPEPRTIDGLELPAWTVSPDGGIWMSAMTKRSTVAVATSSLFVERLQDELRRGLGLSYSAGSNYWRLTAEYAHVLLGADTSPEHSATVTDAFFRILDELIERGPSAEALQRYMAMSERYMGHPDGATGELDAAASDELVGHERLSRAALGAEIRALTPDAVAAELSDWAATAIYQLPAGAAGPESRARRYSSGPNHGPVSGERYTPKIEGADEEITVGDSGATQRAGVTSRTILWEDCVFAGLEGRNALVLIDRWGDSLYFQFRGKNAIEQILGTLRKHVPEERVLEIERELAARQDLVMAAAEDQLGSRDGWALIALARVLFDGEAVQALARGSLNGDDALLAVTDRRMLLVNEAGNRVLLELPRTEIQSAEVRKSLLRSKLLVKSTTDTYEIALAKGRQDALQAALSS